MIRFSGSNKEFYTTEKVIASDVLEEHSLYNIKSGNRVFKYNRDIYTVSIPNSRKFRMIAYYLPVGKNNSGSLYYCSADSILHEIQFSPKDQKDWDDFVYYGNARLEFSDLTPQSRMFRENHLRLWSEDSPSDPSLFPSFSITLKFYEKEPVVIPIINNDFDLRNVSSDYVLIKRIK